ncbi:MAG: Hsp20/alpha crystallin family protein [Patescibacteria group bacterium]
MENSEETFFEKLADERLNPNHEDYFKVELAKAGGNVVSEPKVKAQSKAEQEIESEVEGQLTVDVYQTPNEIIVESAVAGVEPENIDINVTNDSIAIKGKRHREKQVKEEDYFYQECYWGKFSRSVILPQEVDAENSYASFKNGILAVHMPKLNRQKTKKLKVKLE